MSDDVEPIAIKCGCDDCRKSAPATAHDASRARIAGLERSVNEKAATISTLTAEVRHLRRSLGERHIAACEAAGTAEATIAALESQLASESREIAAARESRLVDSLRAVLAIVARTGGYMSPEDQQTLRDARAEVA